MTEFDAALILDPATSESALAQYLDCESRRTAMEEACRIAVKAMRRQSDEPLTPGQLMGMDGQPIWIEHDADPKYNHVWMIWNNEIGMRHNLAGYNIFWRAYAYPPSHIDREALRGEWQGEADGYADGELVYDVWRCGDCGHVEETDDPDLLPRFCPSCGRAMTPEAWAELEKRLRG
mgnify:CR=1 FL=1